MIDSFFLQPTNSSEVLQGRCVDSNGVVEIKHYEKREFLGKGGFAQCFAMKDISNDEIVAGKIIPKSALTKEKARQKLASEIKIHRELSHINVVKMRQFFETREQVVIVLDLCSDKTMIELLKRKNRLTEFEARPYLRQITCGVEYLHNVHVVHRDLKLGNLFLHGDQVKIGDFGLATVIEYEGERKKTICGTPNYIAPEIINSTDGHSYEVDMWALGVVLFALLIGVPPFETSDVRTTYIRIRDNQYSFPADVPLTPNARSLIRRLLDPLPTNRPTATAMRNDSFFASASPSRATIINTFASSSSSSSSPSTRTATKPLASPATTTTTAAMRRISTGNNVNRSPLMTAHALLPPSQSTFSPSIHKTAPTTIAAAATSTIVVAVAKQQQQQHSSPSTIQRAAATIASSIRPVVSLPVRRFIDYSRKYGLGYVTQSGLIGACFNDLTRIVLRRQSIRYWSAPTQDQQANSSSSLLPLRCSLVDFPLELSKKTTLIKFFRDYLCGNSSAAAAVQQANNDIAELNDHNNNNNNDDNNENNNNNDIDVADNNVDAIVGHDNGECNGDDDDDSNEILLHWYRNKRGVVFWLADGAYQVNFSDHCKLYCSATGVITCIDKNGEELKSTINARVNWLRDIVSRHGPPTSNKII